MNVSLLRSNQRHVSASHVAFFRAVKTTIQLQYITTCHNPPTVRCAVFIIVHRPISQFAAVPTVHRTDTVICIYVYAYAYIYFTFVTVQIFVQMGEWNNAVACP
jgi:hypothetical protein